MFWDYMSQDTPRIGVNTFVPTAQFASNKIVNMAIGYNLFYLHSGDQHLVPSAFMHCGCALSHVKAIWAQGGLHSPQEFGSLGNATLKPYDTCTKGAHWCPRDNKSTKGLRTNVQLVAIIQYINICG